MAREMNPKYTNGMPGRNWDILNTQLTAQVIAEMERDAIDMVRYLAQHGDQMPDSWFFRYGGVTGLLSSARADSERQAAKLRNCGSWILAVVSRFVTLVQLQVLQITREALGGEKQELDSLGKVLKEAEMRPAQTALENELIDVLIASVPKFYGMSADGLERFRYVPQTTTTLSLVGQTGSEQQHYASQAAQKQKNGNPFGYDEPVMDDTYSFGKPAQKVLMAFEQGVSDIKSSEIKHIQNRSAESFFGDAVHAQISTKQFNQAKLDYECRKRREKLEYEQAKKSVGTRKTQFLVEQERKRQEKQQTIKNLVMFVVIAAIVVVIAFLMWKSVIYPNMDAESLYTPEILQRYDRGADSEYDDILTITECTEDGHITGIWETGSTKVRLTGIITKKSNNGNIEIKWTNNEVIDGGTYGWRDELTATITDNYQKLTSSSSGSSTKFTASKTYEETDVLDAIRQAAIGDVVTYGTYNDTAIEWQVLDQQDGKILLISKYCLLLRRYHDYTMAEPGWEYSSIRDWLNSDFLSRAFSYNEAQAILWTELKNYENPEYGTSSGADTSDRIFLLSYEELMQYMPENQDRRTTMTASSVTQSWWLRTVGSGAGRAMLVRADGSVDYEGDSMFSLMDEIGCRPAMWLDITQE